MRSTAFTTAVVLSAISLVQAQTFTDCDPTKKTCPADPGLGKTLTTDFTKGKSNDWKYAEGTQMTYGSQGAEFSITKAHEAPTVISTKYIFFGKVTAEVRSSPGTGIVSSFILESDDLDEIDWEWLGSDNDHVQTNFFGKGDITTYDRGLTVAADKPIDNFHTYTIDWNADRIVWSVNNVVLRTLTYNDPTAHEGTRYPQTPMKIKMGSWIGCVDASDPKKKGTCEWAGGQAVFDDSTKYQMFVKSVTIEDYSSGSEYSYGDMSGTWQSIKVSGGSAGGTGSGSSSGSSSSNTKSSAGVFVQSSTSSVASTSTSVSSSESKSSSSSEVNTTLTTTSAPQSTSGSKTSSGPASTTSPPTQTTQPGSANSSKSLGLLNYGVIALGLGLGYLVM